MSCMQAERPIVMLLMTIENLEIAHGKGGTCKVLYQLNVIRLIFECRNPEKHLSHLLYTTQAQQYDYTFLRASNSSSRRRANAPFAWRLCGLQIILLKQFQRSNSKVLSDSAARRKLTIKKLLLNARKPQNSSTSQRNLNIV
uniref:Uncharacterized protein n=1 Tax=Physcomitrium patens TaxID=3218 RepID=A0A2K1K0B9_PHYPA|nr:hypothetical protein PHYPA_014344 [Physcomitrium patens]